ncbi:MAG: cell division protein FtsQ/DivIB [Faecalibacterium sp.]
MADQRRQQPRDWQQDSRRTANTSQTGGQNGRSRSPRRTSSASASARRQGQQNPYREQTLSFESARSAQQAPRRSAQNRPAGDNSIEFPVQQIRRPSAQDPVRSSAPQRSRQLGRSTQRLRPAQGQKVVRDPARREKRKRRRLTRAEVRRRRMMRRLTAFVLTLCVIGAGVYLTVTMLFKINSIQVQTADGAVVQEVGGYSSSAILQALGVQLEENIFSFRPEEKAAALEKVFPLLEQIKVVRHYPNAVVVQVTEAEPAYGMQTRSSWLTLSASLKILSASLEPPGLPTLYGGEPVSSIPGEQLSFALPAAADADDPDGEEASAPADTRLESLNTLLASLEKHGLLADVTRIEFAEIDEIAFLYQDRISVLLGTLNELDYKLDFAAYLLHNTDGKGCAETDTGALDCSHVRSDGTLRPILAQGEPSLPSGYVIPAPVEEAPEEGTEDLDGEETIPDEAAEPAAVPQQAEQ